ncbi:GtrA family protein [Massilia sp. ZL223]|uniref:GtrA family protein n=1 Tax=Massilia sp. ZL223 TaxID=2824904 RepID=UPI001B82C193|nr:GtrA family protein [Massilia sp. ZL223]MBQ5966079.1 GtrA family protein [Massilia sp. ZL223]
MIDSLRQRQFLVFLAGGLLCAGVDAGTMQLLMAAGSHHTAAASAGFAAGLLVNYAFHSRVTFDQAASPASFARYLCVVGLNYLLTIACVALAAALADKPLAGKVLSLPLVALNGYLLGKHWIFK